MLTIHQIRIIKQYFGAKFQVSYVVLFGSAAREMHPHSDIDLFIGGECPFDVCTRASVDLEDLLGKSVDVVHADHTFSELALEAFAHGKEIVMRSRKKFLKDYFRHFYNYDDLGFLRNLRQQQVRSYFGYG